MISIVIPAYNCRHTVGKLIESILDASVADKCELIVVDDASVDGTGALIKKYAVRLISQKLNSGSAKSRNIGVKKATGDIIIFFDADVILHGNTLEKMIAAFSESSEAVAVIGIYSKEPANRGFAPTFKALWDYYQWEQVTDNQPVSVFEPRCAIIKKETFLSVGGFDEDFIGADVEDYEFGYRLLEHGKILVNKSIQVDHHFPDTITALMKTMFLRGSSWVVLFLKRKRFDNVCTTKSAAISCILSLITVLLLAGGFFCKLSLYLLMIILPFFLYTNYSFYRFVFLEKGFAFCLWAVGTHYVMSVVIAIAAIKSLFVFLMKKSWHHEEC